MWGMLRRWSMSLSPVLHPLCSKWRGMVSVIGPSWTLTGMFTSGWGHCALKTELWFPLFPVFGHRRLSSTFFSSVVSPPIEYCILPPQCRSVPTKLPLTSVVKEACHSYLCSWLVKCTKSLVDQSYFFFLQHLCACPSQGFKPKPWSWIQLSPGFCIETFTSLETSGSAGGFPFVCCSLGVNIK